MKNEPIKTFCFLFKSIKQTLNSFYTNFWEELKNSRFSSMSKVSFNTLSLYIHLIFLKKRDGSIVRRVLGQNGEVLTDPKKVASTLIKILKDRRLSIILLNMQEIFLFLIFHHLMRKKLQAYFPNWPLGKL